MGYTLANAAMLEGKYVTYLPAYGVEVRGGTANCTVVVSDEEIASPVASEPEFVVAMNQPSFARFQSILQAGRPALRQLVAWSTPSRRGATSRSSPSPPASWPKSWAPSRWPT